MSVTMPSEKVSPKSGRVLLRHAAAKCRRSVAYYCSAAYTNALISLEKMKFWRGHFSCESLPSKAINVINQWHAQHSDGVRVARVFTSGAKSRRLMILTRLKLAQTARDGVAGGHFGDTRGPLLVSVRSGIERSMSGCSKR